MKLLILIPAIILLLHGQESSSFLYKKENRYSDIQKKYSGLSQPEISGLNLKVTEESLNGLVDKLVNEVEGNGEDIDRDLFQFEDNDDDFDEFEDVDLTSMNDQHEESHLKPFHHRENVVVSTTYGKWGCACSRVFSISGNGTKTFLKIQQGSKEGGKISTKVQGSPDKQMTSRSMGKVHGGVNTTVYHEGKEYKSKVRANSAINSTEVDKKAGKKGDRYISTTSAGVQSSIKIQNKTIQIEIISSSKAETFVAPFQVYFTLFESEWELDVGSGVGTGSGGKIGGKVRGEITSRVVFSKNGKSLTKSYLKGYVTSEGEHICSVKMFRVKSHIWTKVASKGNSSTSESNEVSESVDASTTIDVCTYSKGKVYERAETTKKDKVFAGSGVASYEKAKVSVPHKVGHHEYGVHWMVKNLIDRKLAIWGQSKGDILDF